MEKRGIIKISVFFVIFVIILITLNSVSFSLALSEYNLTHDNKKILRVKPVIDEPSDNISKKVNFIVKENGISIPLVSEKQLYIDRYQKIKTDYIDFELLYRAKHFWMSDNSYKEDVYEVIVYLDIKNNPSYTLKFTWNDERYINEKFQIHYNFENNRLTAKKINFIPFKDNSKLKFKNMKIELGTLKGYEYRIERNETCFLGDKQLNGCLVNVSYPVYFWSEFKNINIKNLPINFLAIDDIEVDSCGSLDTENGIYTLNQSITGVEWSCFSIENQNITLNMNGYSIITKSGGYEPDCVSLHTSYAVTRNFTLKNGALYDCGYGFKGDAYAQYDADGLKIINVLINNSVYDGIYIKSINDVIVRDTVINNTGSDEWCDSIYIGFDTVVEGVNITLDQEETVNTGGSSSYNSIFYKEWYFDVHVNDTADGTNISNATVKVWNVTGSEIFSTLTAEDGKISQQELIEYANNKGTKTYYSNYTVNVTKSDYIPSSKTFNFTTNTKQFFSITKAPKTTISGNFSDNGELYIIGSVGNRTIDITLECSAGAGCGSTIYCIDTTDSCYPNIIYSSPIEVTATTYIRFKSNDTNGYYESIKSEYILIDTSALPPAIDWPECNPADPCCNSSGNFRPSGFVCKNAHDAVCNNATTCSGTAHEDRCDGVSSGCPDSNNIITYNNICDDIVCSSQSCTDYTFQPERTCFQGVCQINDVYYCSNNLNCLDAFFCKSEASSVSDCRTGYYYDDKYNICWLNETNKNAYGMIYDNNGNLISGFGLNYSYNNFNQLENINNSVNGTLISEYLYDHEGNRVRKIKYSDGGNTTTYYFDNFVQIVNSSGVFNETYYYYYDKLVGKKDNNGNIFYYHPDHLGSTTLITDNNGNVVFDLQYEPFGKLILDSNERYTYTGHELDPESDLIYAGARYYNPEIGKFIQPDNIIGDIYDPQSLNKYTYVRNNPYNHIDPEGEWFVSVVIGAAAGAIIGGVISAYSQYKNTRSINAWSVAKSAAIGAVAGGLAGATLGIGTALISRVGLSGGYALAAGAGISGFSYAEYNQISKAGSNIIEGRPVTYGLFKPKEIAVDIGIGGITFGIAKGVGAGINAIRGGAISESVAEGVGNLRGGANPKVQMAASEGKQIHKAWDYGTGFDKEVRLAGGKYRTDALKIDSATGIGYIKELKPNNPKAIAMGEKQLERYKKAAQLKYTDITKWVTEVVTYG